MYKVYKNVINAIIKRSYINRLQSNAIPASNSGLKEDILNSIIKSYWESMVVEQKKKSPAL